MDTTLLIALLAGGGGLATGGTSGWLSGARSKEKELEEQINELKKEILELKDELARARYEIRSHREKLEAEKADAERYRALRKVFEKSRQVKQFRQPVLLVGPVASGKSSLLWQWQAPWDPPPQESTVVLKKPEDVTLYYIEEWLRGPHAYDDTVSIPYEAHLFLRVFDFPGEPTTQPKIAASLVEETKNFKLEAQRVLALREESRESVQKLGVIVICMFDCEALVHFWTDSSKRERLDAHIDYYNASLFKGLKEACATQQVEIDRVLLVFNKFDLVRQYYPEMSDHDRILACRRGFDQHGVTEFLKGTVHPSRMPHMPSVLNPKDTKVLIHGSSTIKKFAAKSLVDTVCGDKYLPQTPEGSPKVSTALDSSDVVLIMQ